MADVRDVLGIGGGGASASSSGSLVSPRPTRSAIPTGGAPGSAAGAAASAPGGVATPGASPQLPRELAQLRAGMSESFVPMAPTVPLAAFKAKRVKAVSWKCLPIRSSARTAHTGKPIDDLDLMHWVKIHNVPDYRFSRFNKPIKFLDYTDEEYENFCHDPNWSRIETDRLMQLAKNYDLRFIIMEDRYNEMSELAAKKLKDSQLPAVDENQIKHIVTDVLKRENDLPKQTATATQPTAPVAPVAPADAKPESTSEQPSSSSSATATSGASTTAAGEAAAAPASSPAPSSAAPSPSSSSSATSPQTPLAAGVFPYRSVESLKARFYFLQQTLTTLRNSSDPDLRKTNPLFTHPYDQTHEMLRKAQLERLYQRSANDLDTMAELVLEHRNVSAAIKKIKKAEKESRDAARGIIKPASKGRGAGAAAPIVAGGVALGAAGAALLNKKKAALVNKLGGRFAGQLPVNPAEMAAIPQTCDASTVLPKRGNNNFFLRSAQLADPLLVNAKQAKLLENELKTLNIVRVKDVPVPTGVVCDLWDKLRVNILTLANLQQHVLEKEKMRDDLRAHAASSAVGVPAATSQYAAAPSYAAPQATAPATPSASQQPPAAAGNLQAAQAAAAANQAALAAAAAAKTKKLSPTTPVEQTPNKRRLEGAPEEQDDKRQKKK